MVTCAMLDEDAAPGDSRRQFRRHAWWVLTAVVYGAIMSVTTARHLGDTVEYAGYVARALRGENEILWEFAHLLWRPLGYLTCRLASPLLDWDTGLDRQTGIVTVLMAWNWLSGLIGALALNRFVIRLGVRPWCVPAITLAYIVTFGVLNHAHSGSSYIPGLACLLVALAIMAGRPTLSVPAAVAAGIALAFAVGFWALYILVIPAALAFPLVWFGIDRRRLRLTGLAAATFVLVLAAAYSTAILQLGIRDVGSLRAWVTSSSHGIVNIKGVSRVAFGIPRSFISMGKDGILFKRFLLKDPYNEVTLGELIRLSLAKIALVYLVLLATFAGLLRGKNGRRLLLLLIIGGLPVLAFAVNWQGGDAERYMPLYPLIFAAWALVLGGERPLLPVAVLVSILVGAMTIVNLSALSRTSAERDRSQAVRRISELLPRLNPEDRIFVVIIQDPLLVAKRDPFFPRTRDFKIGALVPIGYASAPQWRSDFARGVQETWAKGGTVWLSKRVWSERPEPDWDWTEGDEKSVSWSDIPAFFGGFERGQDLGGNDGFASLSRSPANERLIERAVTGDGAERSTAGEARAPANTGRPTGAGARRATATAGAPK